MPFLPSLPFDAGVRHILSFNPEAGRAIIELHCATLRRGSGLSDKDKELIAAFVSGLNACRYCFGVHTETAIAFGVPEALVQQLLEDVDGSDVDPALKPILVYAKVLTLNPSEARQHHVDAIFQAGWGEDELHDAILTVALFNFMNRLVEGHGVIGTQDLWETRGRALHEGGYAPLLSALPRRPSRDADQEGSASSPAIHVSAADRILRGSLLSLLGVLALIC